MIESIQHYHSAPIVRCEIGSGDLLYDLELGLIGHAKTDRMGITNVPLCHQSLSLKYHLNKFAVHAPACWVYTLLALLTANADPLYW